MIDDFHRMLAGLSDEQRQRILDHAFPPALRLFDPPPLDPAEQRARIAHDRIFGADENLRALEQGVAWLDAHARSLPPTAPAPPLGEGGGWIFGWDPSADPYAPPSPYQPNAGERRLAEQLERAGWVDVEVVPPSQHAFADEHGRPVEGAAEARGWDGPDRDWMVYVDGGSDGHPEGYSVIRAEGGEECPRVPSPRVPTPNEAVGAYERWQRTSLEATQPTGRKRGV